MKETSVGCVITRYHPKQQEFHSSGELWEPVWNTCLRVTPLHFHSWVRELKYLPQHLSVIGWGMLGWCWEGPGPLQATERAPAARKALRQRGASAGGWASLPGNGGDREDVGQDSEASASGLQLILVQKFLGGSRAVIAKLGSLRVPVLDSSPYLS